MTDEISRIRITGVPNYVTKKNVRAAFESYGEITDCVVIYSTRSNTVRMAFVGYKTAESARRAVAARDGTYFDTRRIEVTLAEPSVLHKPISTAAPPPAPAANPTLINFKDDDDAQSQNDEDDEAARQKIAALDDKDFLASLTSAGAAARRGAKAPKDDDDNGFRAASSDDDDNAADAGGGVVNKTVKADTPSALKDDDAPLSGSGRVLLRNIPYSAAEGDVLKFVTKRLQQYAIETTQSALEAAREAKTAAAKAAKAQPTGAAAGGKKGAAAAPGEEKANTRVAQAEQDAARAEATYGVRVGGQRVSLRPQGVHIPLTSGSKLSRGVAYVILDSQEAVGPAVDALGGSIFEGRIVNVEAADAARKTSRFSAEGAATFAQQRAAERKANAGTAEETWNSLYMRTDAVAEAVAARAGVSVVDFAGVHTANLAARLATAEAALTSEAAAALDLDGDAVDESALSGGGGGGARSTTTFLVKGLPAASAAAEELRTLMAKFGSLRRVVVAPSSNLLLAEYAHADDARKAYRRMAFMPFKGHPLFLEWASVRALRPAKRGRTEDADADAADADGPRVEDGAGGSMALRDVKQVKDVVSVYIRNLQHQTDEDRLRRAVSELAGPETAAHVRSVRIVRRSSAGSDAMKLVSGFIEVSSGDAAADILRAFDRAVVDGREVNAQLARSGTGAIGTGRTAAADADVPAGDGDDTVPAGCDPTILIVKNVPFEGTANDIRAIFSAFTTVKDVHLPKKRLAGAAHGKQQQQHRGFAFVEFRSAKEAATARRTLSRTHLYGRHLVLEYAAKRS